MKKLTDHPVSIGSYPAYYRKVMTYFTHVLAGADRNNNCKNNVGKIIAMPSGRQMIHQLMSLKSQNTMWRFSILRYRSGML